MIFHTLVRRVRPVDAGLVAILAALLVAVHATALAALVGLWNRSPMYSYGFTVPVISGYLLWVRRADLVALTPRPAVIDGLAVLGAGIALLLVGAASTIVLLQQLAFLVSLVGLVLLVFGRAYVRVAWAALAYLLLMIPIWDGFTEPLHWPFQLKSAEFGEAVMRAVGVPVLREGTLITLPRTTFEVARSCSGVNYLIAVIALGLPLAYLYLGSTWRRLVLILSAVAIAAVSNGLRVALIGILAHLEIGSPLHGPFHVLHGLFVAAIGYVVLFLGLRLLGDRRPAPTGSELSSAPVRFRVPRVHAVLAILVLASAGFAVRAERVTSVPLRAGLAVIPEQIGPWSSEAGPLGSSAWPWWGGADAQLQRRYRRTDGVVADLFVAYFAEQREQRELVSFRNAAFHRSASPLTISAPGRQPLEVNLVRELDGREMLALFWYEVDGHVERDEYWTKFRVMRNALLRHRTNGAAIVVSSPRESVGRAATLDDLEKLGLVVHEALGAALPGREEE